MVYKTLNLPWGTAHWISRLIYEYHNCILHTSQLQCNICTSYYNFVRSSYYFSFALSTFFIYLKALSLSIRSQHEHHSLSAHVY